jgi:hypothetical protein
MRRCRALVSHSAEVPATGPPTLIQSVRVWGLPRTGGGMTCESWAAGAGVPPAAIEPPTGWQPAVRLGASGQADLDLPVLDGERRPIGMVRLGLTTQGPQPAAVEIWQPDASLSMRLDPLHHWYSEAAHPLARFSTHVRLASGQGMPGLAREVSGPAYLPNIGQSELFGRGHGARLAGLHHGLAVPLPDEAGGQVAVLLSGAAQPLARRVELAIDDQGGWRCIGGHCMRDGDLWARHLRRPWGHPLLGAVSDTRRAATDLQRSRFIGAQLLRRQNPSAPDPWFAPLDAHAVLSWTFHEPGTAARLLMLWL